MRVILIIDAIAVIVGICIISDLIAVGIEGFTPIGWERIGVIANAITVGIGGFAGVLGELIVEIRDSVAIRIEIAAHDDHDGREQGGREWLLR